MTLEDRRYYLMKLLKIRAQRSVTFWGSTANVNLTKARSDLTFQIMVRNAMSALRRNYQQNVENQKTKTLFDFPNPSRSQMFDSDFERQPIASAFKKSLKQISHSLIDQSSLVRDYVVQYKLHFLVFRLLLLKFAGSEQPSELSARFLDSLHAAFGRLGGLSLDLKADLKGSFRDYLKLSAEFDHVYPLNLIEDLSSVGPQLQRVKRGELDFDWVHWLVEIEYTNTTFWKFKLIFENLDVYLDLTREREAEFKREDPFWLSRFLVEHRIMSGLDCFLLYFNAFVKIETIQKTKVHDTLLQFQVGFSLILLLSLISREALDNIFHKDSLLNGNSDAKDFFERKVKFEDEERCELAKLCQVHSKSQRDVNTQASTQAESQGRRTQKGQIKKISRADDSMKKFRVYRVILDVVNFVVSNELKLNIRD